MKEKTVTLKQLYQYVEEYVAEAQAEGFEVQVGDFVDWVASQDGEPEDKPGLPEKLAIHSSQCVGDPDTLLDILLDTQHAVNQITDYLRRKDE